MIIEIFILIVLFYFNIKLFHTEKTSPLKIYNLIAKNRMRVLTYNIQRLPYLFRPTINVKQLMDKYDVVCL